MYQFSRAIYRELAHESSTTARVRRRPQPRARPAACEATIERLATDRHYFAKPARTLFNDIRPYFPMGAQRGSGASSSATSPAPTIRSRSSRATATTSTATRCSAARRPARAPPASGCRCRTTATARRTSTSPRPSEVRGELALAALIGACGARSAARSALASPRCSSGSTSAAPSPTPCSSTADGCVTAKAPTTPDDQSGACSPRSRPC